ncbi:ABC transporter permease [Niabella beijingensis]|uniref:ABC transporter permease n=1 Tax=Niabella beijingensis TaxID=2872700 RepID=UPI001CC010D7|nr:ABC transporter permease [Niabella beijingensis]MBZ4191479.1 ABC transporter permease [Niabella beijingensis]
MINNYFKTAWRSIRRNKTQALINIIGLTMSFTVLGLIVLYVLDEYSYDRFYTNANRIVRVVQHTKWNGNELHQATTSAPFAPELKKMFPEVEDAVRIDLEGGGVISYKEQKFKQDDIIFADPSLIRIFSYDFLYGNPGTALSDPQSIVISESLAGKLFGTASRALMETIYFNGQQPARVTGVIRDVPANTHLRFSAVRPFPEAVQDGWQNFHYYTYLLLRKGTLRPGLEKKLPGFAAATIQQRMRVNDYKIELQPLTSIHLHSALDYELSQNSNSNRVYLLIVIAALVLAVAVINYLNLTTAGSVTRTREIAIRKVVGSAKRDIVALFVAESVLVTGVAVLLAFLAVQLSLPWFSRFVERELSFGGPGLLPATGAIFIFIVVIGCLSGLYPALLLLRLKTAPALKGKVTVKTEGLYLRRIFVIFQFTVAGVLIPASVIIFRQLQYVLQADLGFDKEQVLTFHIDEMKVRGQLPGLKNRLLQYPVIEAVAVAGNPIGNNDLGGLSYRFETPGGGFSTATTAAQELMIDAAYLPAMDIRLLSGRNFSDSIRSDQYGAALINETLMRKLGWKDAIGKKMQFSIDDSGHTAERTIVGVVKDFHTYSLQHPVTSLVMVMPPATAMEDNLYVRVAKGKEREALAHIAKVYREFDPANVTSYHFLRDNFSRQYATEEKQEKMALLFTGVAVLIAGLGLFGLVSIMAVQRTREIGVRKVLGAGVAGIVRLFSAEFLKLIGIAVLIAIPLTWWGMHRWLEGFAYRITIPWWMFLCTGSFIIIVALLTVSIRALRAARANPVAALRNE